MSNVARRVGLFGGTFDPVHFGHLRTALEVAETYSLDAIHLLPNHQPVHRGPTDASTDHRLNMLELGVSNSKLLKLDTREATRGGASYTIDTLSALHEEMPDAHLIFVMGMDAFAKFDTWNDWPGILKLAQLVILDRPDATHSEFSRQLLDEHRGSPGDSHRNSHRDPHRDSHRDSGRDSGRNSGCNSGGIDICNVTQLAISASNIRYRAQSGLSLQFLVPESVREYIERHNLYR